MGEVTIISNEIESINEANHKSTFDTLISSSIIVSISPSIIRMTPFVIDVCKDLIKKWAKLDDSCFSVETLSGGITNLLLKISVMEEDMNEISVTVRLFGPNTEYVIDRERELKVIKYLSTSGFGAKLLGVFGNGMIQSFIDALTLTPSDIKNPKLVSEIAKQLHKFHQVHIPGSKEPQLWHDITKFFRLASTLRYDDITKDNLYKKISFEELHEEINQLMELTDRLDSPIVFAHNDLLCGNLMFNNEQEKLYIIDFEYASYNYRGFDIGNHFNEYAGFDCDYNLYPCKDEQYHFFTNYLQPEKAHEVSDKELEALYVEASSYMLASHLYWGLWALIQAKMSRIDFDYLGYFFLRYNEYKKRKEMMFSLAQTYLSTACKG